MSSPNNQNTLFRFRTLRSPELSNPINQPKRFVFHPDNAGHFFTAIQPLPPDKTKWEALAAAAVTYDGLPGKLFRKVDDVNAFQPTFAVLANYISRNKGNLDVDYVYTTALPLIAAVDEKRLWDNLFYQIIAQKSFYIKDLLIQYLIVQNLVKHTRVPESEAKEIIPLLANATVVLPTQLFDDIEKASDTPPSELRPPRSAGKMLNDLDNLFKAKTTTEVYFLLKDEVVGLEKKQSSRKNTEYNSHRREHNQEVANVKKRYDAEMETEVRQLCPHPADYDPTDICNIPNIPIPELPVFQASIDPDALFADLKKDLSEEYYALLKALYKVEPESAPYQEIYERIDNKIAENHAFVTNKAVAERKVLVVGDSAVPVIDPLAKGENFTYKFCVGTPDLPGGSAHSLTISTNDLTLHLETFEFWYVRLDGTESEHLTVTFSINYFGGISIPGIYANDDLLGALDIAAIEKVMGILTFTNGLVMDFSSQITNRGCVFGVLKEHIEITPPSNETPSQTDFIPNKFGYRQLGIADYRKVVQEVCCYDAGEVAHIENIMAREFKEKTTEKITTKETTVFESEESEKETLTDTISTQRFEMQNEIAKMLQEQTQMTAYADVHANIGTTTLDVGGTYASNNTKEESNNQAVTQSKELTERATERIVSRIKKETTVKVTESFRDTNSHIFDNRESASHVSGVYRFINAIYKNQIFNYGKRLMYEFMIPEPSKLHRLGMKVSNSNLNEVLLDIPVTPKSLGINNYESIKKETYKDFAAAYNADVESYPESIIFVSQTFDFFHPTPNGVSCKSNAVQINDDRYVSTSAKISFNATGTSGGPMWPNVKIVVGDNASHVHTFIYYDQTPFFNIERFSKQVPFVVGITNLHTVQLSVTVKCELTQEAIEDWKKKTYNSIIAAYNTQLQIYNQKLAEAKASGTEMLDSNPGFYRQIEQTVLRKNCIAYMMNEAQMGLPFHEGTTLQAYKINQTQQMDDYLSKARFMEQAFEWNLMSYNFYPFYWGDRENDWKDLYQFESNDAIYRSFMQAGMGRVVVTVKPGFEKAIMHYLATGQIWNGGELPVLGDPLYLSIVDELAEQEYVIEKTWETVLPTNLVALQSGGAAIIAGGLPCSEDCKEASENNQFKENKNILGFPKVKEDEEVTP